LAFASLLRSLKSKFVVKKVCSKDFSSLSTSSP